MNDTALITANAVKKMGMFFNKKLNEVQMGWWIQKLQWYDPLDVTSRADECMSSMRFMPTIDEFCSGIHKTAYQSGQFESEHVELSENERAFNMEMFENLKHLIAKQLKVEEFVRRAVVLERKHGIEPLDWSGVTSNVTQGDMNFNMDREHAWKPQD